jgi:hypothetical protein
MVQRRLLHDDGKEEREEGRRERVRDIEKKRKERFAYERALPFQNFRPHVDVIMTNVFSSLARGVGEPLNETVPVRTRLWMQIGNVTDPTGKNKKGLMMTSSQEKCDVTF